MLCRVSQSGRGCRVRRSSRGCVAGKVREAAERGGGLDRFSATRWVYLIASWSSMSRTVRALLGAAVFASLAGGPGAAAAGRTSHSDRSPARAARSSRGTFHRSWPSTRAARSSRGAFNRSWPSMRADCRRSGFIVGLGTTEILNLLTRSCFCVRSERALWTTDFTDDTDEETRSISAHRVHFAILHPSFISGIRVIRGRLPLHLLTRSCFCVRSERTLWTTDFIARRSRNQKTERPRITRMARIRRAGNRRLIVRAPQIGVVGKPSHAVRATNLAIWTCSFAIRESSRHATKLNVCRTGDPNREQRSISADWVHSAIPRFLSAESV